MYESVALNCFRYLDYTSFSQVDALTIPQYRLLMRAVRLKQFDLDYRNHAQAFLNFAVTAKKRSGKNEKPVYGKFKKFFDYEKAEKKALEGEKKRFEGLKEYLKNKEKEGE